MLLSELTYRFQANRSTRSNVSIYPIELAAKPTAELLDGFFESQVLRTVTEIPQEKRRLRLLRSLSLGAHVLICQPRTWSEGLLEDFFSLEKLHSPFKLQCEDSSDRGLTMWTLPSLRRASHVHLVDGAA